LAGSHAPNIEITPQPYLKQEELGGDFHTAQTLLVSSAHAIHDLYGGFIAPLLPFLIERLSLLKAQAGMFLLFYQGASILQPLIGHLADRINLRKFALLMPAVTAIALSLLGTAPTYSIAIICSLVGGLASASLHAILPALVGSLSGRQLGKGISFWMVGGEIGVMLGPLLVTIMVTSFPIEATRWLMIPGILISILLSFLLKDVPHHNSGNHQNTKAPIKEMTLIMLPLAGIIIMRVLLRTSAEIYLPLFMLEKGASIWLAGLSLTILQGFGVIGTIAGGFLKDKYGFKIVMLMSIVLSSIGMLVFVHTSGALMFASLALMGVVSMMILPVGMSFIQ